MNVEEYYEESLRLHAEHLGKLEIISKAPVKNIDDYSVVYMPGVAGPCLRIARDPREARLCSIKANTVAVVSDGSDVYGLGNIGGLAALPVIEGKAVLLKEFGGVDAFPICLDTQDENEIIETVKRIAPTFGGILLEDIASPRSFTIEKRLNEELDIPVFHDDRHGTGVVVGAAIINAFRLLGRPLSDARAVIAGAGAAGAGIARILPHLGIRDTVVCDSKGIIGASRFSEFGEDKMELLEYTNRDGLTGGLAEAVLDRNIFIGVSKARVLTEKLLKTMAEDPVIFAMSYPEPEVLPGVVKKAGVRVICTGRQELPNRIDNTLAFPGIFRGALDAGATDITDLMTAAAAFAIAGEVPAAELTEDKILPSLFEGDVAGAVAIAVADAWTEDIRKKR